MKQICSYFLGDPKKHIKGKNITELCKLTGIKSRQTIYDYLNRGIEAGIKGIKKDSESGRYERVEITTDEKFELFCKNNPITQDALIKDWISSSLATGGFSGSGVVAAKAHIRAVFKLCNYCKVNPLQLIQDKDLTGSFLEKYLAGLRSGDIPRMNLRHNSSPEVTFYPIMMGVRSFVQSQGLHLRKGLGGIWNAKTKGHGNHADIKLTPEQFSLMEKYLMEHGGIDSDLYRLVWIGIESCARKEALLNIPLSYTVDDADPDNITYFMEAVESKTKHIKQGRQTKHITRKRTQDSLDFLSQRPNKNLIWDEEVTKEVKYKKTLLQLKQLWQAIGCTSYYFFEEPFHSLRHIGAHYWLKATNYDYEFVAMIGGWTTTSELKESYGEIPPEVVAAKMREFRVKIKDVGI